MCIFTCEHSSGYQPYNSFFEAHSLDWHDRNRPQMHWQNIQVKFKQTVMLYRENLFPTSIENKRSASSNDIIDRKQLA